MLESLQGCGVPRQFVISRRSLCSATALASTPTLTTYRSTVINGLTWRTASRLLVSRLLCRQCWLLSWCIWRTSRSTAPMTSTMTSTTHRSTVITGLTRRTASWLLVTRLWCRQCWLLSWCINQSTTVRLIEAVMSLCRRPIVQLLTQQTDLESKPQHARPRPRPTS